MNNLVSKITKLRCAVEVLNLVKELENKEKFYVHFDNYSEVKSIEELIAKKAGIPTLLYSGEAGMVDISEYITLTLAKILHGEYLRMIAYREQEILSLRDEINSLNNLIK